MEKMKLKELIYNGKSIKDELHRIVLFDKDHRLIKYVAIKKYAENYVIEQKEVSGSLYVVIDKVHDCADDLDIHCPYTFEEDKNILDPENIKHAEPTIHFDKKVLESGLTFREAYMRMVEGKKISRPCFMGWWFMNHESKVVIHDRHDNELKEGDITNTVTNTLANDWEVIE